MRHWMLKITEYAERVVNDLDDRDWPESTKEMQRNWIGKSIGAEIEFQLEEHPDKLRVFTTRPDTIYGATYMVLAPEHYLVDEITTAEQKEAGEKDKQAAASKSDLERHELTKEKTGVLTGAYATNPVRREREPIWMAAYVLAQ